MNCWYFHRRDTLIDQVLEHAHDSKSYCRARTLQVFDHADLYLLPSTLIFRSQMKQPPNDTYSSWLVQVLERLAKAGAIPNKFYVDVIQATVGRCAASVVHLSCLTCCFVQAV